LARIWRWLKNATPGEAGQLLVAIGSLAIAAAGLITAIAALSLSQTTAARETKAIVEVHRWIPTIASDPDRAELAEIITLRNRGGVAAILTSQLYLSQDKGCWNPQLDTRDYDIPPGGIVRIPERYVINRTCSPDDFAQLKYDLNYTPVRVRFSSGKIREVRMNDTKVIDDA